MSMKIGVIGIGIIARVYLRVISQVPELELAGVCDLEPARTRAYAARGVTALTDYRALLDDPQIDGVAINLPNHLHYRVAREALAAGKHVCCEKPLTLRPAEARELCEFAARQRRAMITAFHRRHNRNFLAALPVLAQGPPIVRVTARYLERIEDHAGGDTWYLNPEQSGGGCVADNGPNVFDSLMRFLGSLRVVRSTIVWDERGVDREAEIDLRTAGGVPVHVQLDWAYPHGECKDLTVELEDGSSKHVDLLEGYPGFKESLDHEYVAVWREFLAGMRDARVDWTAAENVSLVAAAYAAAPRDRAS